MDNDDVTIRNDKNIMCSFTLTAVSVALKEKLDI